MSQDLIKKQPGDRQRKTWNCQRCDSAAFPNFRGGTSSPPAAAKCVRTNSRILDTL